MLTPLPSTVWSVPVDIMADPGYKFGERHHVIPGQLASRAAE